MIAALIELAAISQATLWTGIVVFLRVGAMMAVLPVVGEQVVPVRVRLALTLAFCLIVAPAVQPMVPAVPGDLLPALVPMLSEVIAGLLFGLFLRFMVLALQVAGTIAAQSTALSQIFGGTAGVDPQPAMSHLLVVGGLALAAMAGLHVQFAAYILQSYTLVPVGVLADSGTVVDIGIAAVSRVFSLGFSLAAPFLVASLVYNATLGVINRAMPQLMVSFVGAPAITAGGLLLFLLCAPIMLSLWFDAWRGSWPTRSGMAMSEATDDDKQFEPSQKKLDDARKKGEVPRSADMTTAAVYGGFLVSGMTFGAAALLALADGLMPLLDQADALAMATFGGQSPVLGGVIARAAVAVGPLFAVPAVCAILAILAQQAFVVAPSRLEPKLSRISIIQGFKNKFGRNGLFEFAKSLVKLAVYAVVLGVFLSQQLERIIGAMYMSPGMATAELLRLVVALLWIVFCVAVAIGLVDLVWQRAEHLRKHRMSRKEMMDEHKHAEGDPVMKQQRRQKAVDLAMNKMLQDVPTADVVIVNPTHFAVALKWERMAGTAPVCVAKGTDAVAARIREIAAEHGVPLHSDPPTARALFATIDIGAEVPPDHYRAVAAAIRFAENLRKASRGRT